MAEKREKPLVLLIDDEPVFLEIASTKLQHHGFDTVLTQNYRDAIEKAEKLLPDLVLTDIYMAPGPSGWDLALELRRNPKTHDVRVAFFTSLRDPWAELQYWRKGPVLSELGDVPFLSKTDDVEVLAQRVGAIIGR